MDPRMELRTRQYRQNAQNFGPELLDQVVGPKIPNKKFYRWRWLQNKMPLELAAASRPTPSTGLDAGVQCISQKYV